MISGQAVTVQTAPPGTVQVPAQLGLTIYTLPAVQSSNIRENYASKTSQILGILQCVFGSVAFILEIIGIIIRVGIHISGAGIWCGIIFIVSGVLGIMAAKTKKTCLIVGFMVMSIIAAAGAIFGLVVLYSASAGLDNDGYNYNYLRTLRLAVDGMMLLLALAECVTAIISSAICCAATCCYSRSTTGYVNAANQTQQIILQPPGQQQVIYQMQPVVAYTPPQTHVQYPIQGLGDSRPVTKQQTVVPPIYTEETHPPPYGDPSAPGMAYPGASGYSQPLENHLQKM